MAEPTKPNSNPKPKPAGSEPESKQARTRIAFLVLGFSIAGVIIFGFAMLAFAKDKAESAQYVLASILPLLGTWVGTVLAYYFSKDNFESATRSTKELLGGIDQRLAGITVTDVMIPYADLVKVESDDDKSIGLTDWLQKIDTAKKGQRLPVFSSKSVARYVIHRSVITSYLAAKALDGKSKADLEQLNLEDLINDRQGLKDVIESFGAVKQDATLDLSLIQI